MGVSLNSYPHFQMGMTRDTGDTIHNNTLPCTPHTNRLYTISAPSSPPSPPHPCCIRAVSMLYLCGCLSKFPSLPHPHLKMEAIDQAYTPHSAPTSE